MAHENLTPSERDATGERLGGATVVCKAGNKAREYGRVWRIHAGFDLPRDGQPERFSADEVPDANEAERIDRFAVTPGAIDT